MPQSRELLRCQGMQRSSSMARTSQLHVRHLFSSHRRQHLRLPQTAPVPPAAGEGRRDWVRGATAGLKGSGQTGKCHKKCPSPAEPRPCRPSSAPACSPCSPCSPCACRSARRGTRKRRRRCPFWKMLPR
ncbi:hypothetical protein DV515_00015197 [Chloebia gouldiae]|uniref:Uncharacterized protein n=1 Tax=Chloebia gouldiae TaxID=44316 RepID=A0A3L8RXF9_CHLGU|nr:hypothetical protein DV515_00015197 [Chloebia gouldiae]